ncbi:uncharacterized protein LOC122373751 [Amphibalanus amphitrite]|uniref:uncharacterized protein LOC122373751 n=1 Tax=Amphibalanus amphitrite TaxID=1232801 RepID=UPI001C912F06|nr:uncharacterized protein LOC122373751 [Amphibalanus amphitrite]
MLVAIEASVMFSLLAWPAAWADEIPIAKDIARSSSSDDWAKDLLKYDFENRIWDSSFSNEESLTKAKKIDDSSHATDKAKIRKTSMKIDAHEHAPTNRIGNHDQIPVEYSKKVNDYFLNTQWTYGTAAGLSTEQAGQHVLRPVIDLRNIVPIPDPDYEAGLLYKSGYKEPSPDNYIYPVKSRTKNTTLLTWEPGPFQADEDDGSITYIDKRPLTVSSHPNKYKEHQGLGKDHETSQLNDDYDAQEIRNILPPKNLKPFLSFGNLHHKQRFPHEKFRRPPKTNHKKNVWRPKPKKPLRPPFQPGKKRHPRPPARPRKPFHPTRKHIQKQHADSSNVVIHFHETKKPHRFHRPPVHGGWGALGLSTRLTPMAVVCGVLLVGTLAVLGYLIWLTPPTIVTYSKRQRDDAGADLLAAPFQLSQLIELAAQLSQALAEAELVTLKLSAAGESQRERWRSCQPLQLCRALVEGDLLHNQPVWSRYIRAAPWLWLFGLDDATAARLQELAHHPDFRSCQPFFESCDRS